MATKGLWNIGPFNIPDFGLSEAVTPWQSNPLIPYAQAAEPAPTGGGGSWGGTPQGQTQQTQPTQQTQQPTQQTQQPSGDQSRMDMWRALGNTGDLPVGWFGSGGGDGGGDGGGGQPAIDYNALFAPAFEAYSQYEQTLKGQQAGIASGIEASGAGQVGELEAEQAKRMGTFEGQEASAKAMAGEATQDIRREQSEIQKGIQSRFGGTTGTGGFASEILGSQSMRQMGKQRVALQNTLGEIDRSRNDLKSEVMTQVSKVKLQVDQLKANARNEFEMSLERINLAKGELEIRKAEQRIDALNSYQDNLAQLKAQEQDFKQTLLTADAQGNAFLTAFQNRAYQDFQTSLYSLGDSPVGETQLAKTYTPKTVKGKTETEEEEDPWEKIMNALGEA